MTVAAGFAENDGFFDKDTDGAAGDARDGIFVVLANSATTVADDMDSQAPNATATTRRNVRPSASSPPRPPPTKKRGSRSKAPPSATSSPTSHAATPSASTAAAQAAGAAVSAEAVGTAARGEATTTTAATATPLTAAAEPTAAPRPPPEGTAPSLICGTNRPSWPIAENPPAIVSVPLASTVPRASTAAAVFEASEASRSESVRNESDEAAAEGLPSPRNHGEGPTPLLPAATRLKARGSSRSLSRRTSMRQRCKTLKVSAVPTARGTGSPGRMSSPAASCPSSAAARGWSAKTVDEDGKGVLGNPSVAKIGTLSYKLSLRAGCGSDAVCGERPSHC